MLLARLARPDPARRGVARRPPPRPRSFPAHGALWALLALLVLVAPRPAQAEPFAIADTSWEGCSELYEIAQAELGSSRVRAVGVLDWDEVRPHDAVIMLHPQKELATDDATAFMKEGGRLAMLDDFGRGDALLERFRIYRKRRPAKPVSALRNNAELALAEPVLDAEAGRAFGPHPVVAGVERLVTNHPTALDHPDLSPVLRIRAIGEPDAIIAVAGQVGEGRLFAMSDPSAVINLMLRYPGNRAFAVGLVRYLIDRGEDGEPRGRLYIVSNRFKEEGSFGERDSLAGDLDEQLDAFVEWLEEIRATGLPPWLLLALAGGTALLIARWVVKRSARPYKSPLPRFARPQPLIAQAGVAGRFALLAAPSSPRSLALLELQSALFECLGPKLGVGDKPTQAALRAAMRKSSMVPSELVAELDPLLSTMEQVESAVVNGRPPRVSKAVLDGAHRLIARVLEATGTLPPRSHSS